jgi:hypothetical protein
MESGIDSALSCTISDPSTSCNAATNVTIEDGNSFSFETDPSATAPAGTTFWGSMEIAP